MKTKFTRRSKCQSQQGLEKTEEVKLYKAGYALVIGESDYTESVKDQP